MFWLSFIGVHDSYASHALPGLILMAIGSGFCFSSNQNAALHQVNNEDAGLASGVQQAIQQVGGAVGLAALATIALRHANHQIAHGVGQALASVQGDTLAFQLGAAIMAIGAVLIAVVFEKVESLSPDQLAAAGAH
jgi:MFS-type transporter involved in bile tolerance (Atg22 family)